jgi:hypothetical protein
MAVKVVRCDVQDASDLDRFGHQLQLEAGKFHHHQVVRMYLTND